MDLSRSLLTSRSNLNLFSNVLNYYYAPFVCVTPEITGIYSQKNHFGTEQFLELKPMIISIKNIDEKIQASSDLVPTILMWWEMGMRGICVSSLFYNRSIMELKREKIIKTELPFKAQRIIIFF